jgi:hypothetical protein
MVVLFLAGSLFEQEEVLMGIFFFRAQDREVWRKVDYLGLLRSWTLLPSFGA